MMIVLSIVDLTARKCFSEAISSKKEQNYDVNSDVESIHGWTYSTEET